MPQLMQPEQWIGWAADNKNKQPLPVASYDFPALKFDSPNGNWHRWRSALLVQAPVEIAGWFEWNRNYDPTYQHAGINIGFKQGNNHGYHLSIREGVTQYLIEYHPLVPKKEYTRFAVEKENTVKPDGVRHQFSMTILNSGGAFSRIYTSLDNQEVAETAHPFPRMYSGYVNLRLDRQNVTFGGLSVREI